MASSNGKPDLSPAPPVKDTEMHSRKRRNETGSNSTDKQAKLFKNSAYLEVELEGDETVELGQSARLTAKFCTGSVVAKFKARWQRFVNHKHVDIILTDDKYAGSTTDLGGPGSTHLVINDSKFTDEGLYQLKLVHKENTFNTICIQKFLKVAKKSDPPVIMLSGNERVDHDERSVFTANISFSDELSNYSAKWQKIDDGNMVDVDTKSEKYDGSEDVLRKNKKLKLVINQVKMTDQGTYQLSISEKGCNRITCMQKMLYVDIKKEWKKQIQFDLLNKIATQALRKHFTMIVPDSNLDSHLKCHEAKLKPRCKPFEMKILYPGKGCVSSEQLDVSLMYKVIRNTFPVPRPTIGWAKLPPGGTTQSDDVERVREHRNVNSHDGNLTDFDGKWKDLSEAIERLGGKEMKKEVNALKKKTIFDSKDNQRLASIEDSLGEIKAAIKDGRMAATAPSRQKEKPMVLVPFRCQRKCGSCDLKFHRPAAPPNNVVFRQQVPRLFYAGHERKLKFDKIHYHITCVSADGNHDFVIDPEAFKGVVISQQHIQFFNDYRFTKLIDVARKHNDNVGRIADN